MSTPQELASSGCLLALQPQGMGMLHVRAEASQFFPHPGHKTPAEHPGGAPTASVFLAFTADPGRGAFVPAVVVRKRAPPYPDSHGLCLGVSLPIHPSGSLASSCSEQTMQYSSLQAARRLGVGALGTRTFLAGRTLRW